MSRATRGRSVRQAFRCGVVGLAFVAGPAFAAPITYNYTAEISVLSDFAGGPVVGLSLGDAVTGSFTYDNDVALSPGINVSRQDLIDAGLTPGVDFHAGMANALSQSFEVAGGDPLFSITFTIGANTFTAGGESLIRHRTNEWVITPDRPPFAYDTMLAYTDLAGSFSGIRLMDDGVFTGTFPSDRTLAALPDLADLYLARVFTSVDLDGDGELDTQVFARVTSLTPATVPEPGTLSLLLAGLLAVGLRHRRT